MVGGTATATSYKWAHLLQLPLLLLLNGALAWYYWRKGRQRDGSTWRRFGPLAIHVIGMCCVLVMPVSVIFEVDMKYGFSDDPVHAPPITKGGFEHHGPVVAFFEIIGVSCLIAAGFLGAGVHETCAALWAGSKA